MKKLFIISLLSLTIPVYTALGQEEPEEKRGLVKSFYIEAGADFISCYEPDDKDYIRGDVNPNPYYYYETSYMSALLYKNYLGAKLEIKILDDMIGVLSGVRFTRMEGSLGKNTYWSDRSDFLYLLYRQSGTTTEYLKVRDITQVSYYAGIPLEFRIYPYRDRFIQMYYKFGADFNLLLGGKTKVKFVESSMNQYESDVENLIEDPWKFYSTFQLGVGMKIGKAGKPGVNLEACVPEFIAANIDNSFVSPDFGGGFRLSIRIPL